MYLKLVYGLVNKAKLILRLIIGVYMAGMVKQKLALLLVEALSDKNSIDFDPNKLQLQRPTMNNDCANWCCTVPTLSGIGIEVFGWNTMTECVKYGLSLSNTRGFNDVYAKMP
jgi:hypothetical protein